MAGQRLCDHEREEIRAGIERDESFAAIARGLGRPTSTVSREVARNRGRVAYSATVAGRRAVGQARLPRLSKLDADAVLGLKVRKWMLEGYSPCATSRLLAGEGHTISHETIYAACYAGRHSPLGGNAWRLLPRKRRARRHRRDTARKSSVLGGFRPISQRPASVADRSRRATSRVT